MVAPLLPADAVPVLALHASILMHVPHWLEITLVVLHVLGATVWVGGTIALTFIAVPAVRTLTGEPRATAMRGLGERWRPIGWSALLAMVLTGAPLASISCRTAARAPRPSSP